MSSNARANVRITNEKQKENSHEGIKWSEIGKQNEQAKKVYCEKPNDLTGPLQRTRRLQSFLMQ